MRVVPGISDPGFLLARACQRQGRARRVPARRDRLRARAGRQWTALRHLSLEGFLPHKKGRQTRLKYLAELPHTFILYESPFRLLKCLEELAVVCGAERTGCVARENCSKMFEEVKTASLAELQAYFGAKTVKGEIVVVVEGKPAMSKR